jgi:hypothetical protein
MRPKSAMKTVAYQGFWQNLKELTLADHQLADSEVTARSYLNINPEGELLREIHDISEELRMMTRVYNDQVQVLEEFFIHLEKMLPHDNNSPTNGEKTKEIKAVKAIPKSTKDSAKKVCNDIILRRKQLEDLEKHSEMVSGQVCLPAPSPYL